MKTSVFTQCQSFYGQQTVISLDSANRGQLYILSISATQGTQLTGQITFNGELIKEFKDNPTKVNITPLLSKGRQSIKITGNYHPTQSLVKVKFSHHSTKITQHTSGNGILNQTLIINAQ